MTNTVVTACALVIGNEILSGRTQDANLNHIALTLAEWGIRLKRALVIPDEEDVIVEAVRSASTAFDYVFTTGGIGPTHDDITADCMAKAFDVPLIIHPEIEAIIRHRPAPDDIMASRLRMARVPQGASLIDNPTGGPQGFCIRNVYVMAGIPAVMRAMLSTLRTRLRTGAIVQSRTVTAYLGESTIATGLDAIAQEFASLDIGSYPFFRDDRYGTSLVLRGTDEAVLEEALTAVVRLIEHHGGDPVFPDPEP